MWDLPSPGLEPVSAALAGRFLTTVPPGKSQYLVLNLHFWVTDEVGHFYYLCWAFMFPSLWVLHSWFLPSFLLGGCFFLLIHKSSLHIKNIEPRTAMCIITAFIWVFNLPFFSFWLRLVACGILVPRPEIKPSPSAVKAQSPNHWTSRKFP